MRTSPSVFVRAAARGLILGVLGAATYSSFGCEREDAMTPHEPADPEIEREHPPDFQGGGPGPTAAPVPPTVAPGEPQPKPTEKPGGDAGREEATDAATR